MERFVFVLAVAAAILFAVVSFSGGKVRFFGWGEGWEEVHAAAAEQIPARAYVAREIEVRHAAARIVVLPEDRQDVVLEIDNSAGATPTPTVRLEAGRLVIDGRLRGRTGNCTENGVQVVGYGAFGFEQLPLITLRTPLDVSLDASGGAQVRIGPAQSVDFAHSGCGAAEIGDVAGELDLDIAGAGALQAGTAGRLDIDLAGSGAASIGAVAGPADVSMAGSGRVEIAAVAGALDIESGGSGKVNVGGGDLPELDVSTAGSGEVQVTATRIGAADIEIGGSGRVRIAAPVARLSVSAAGSGSVVVEGEVGDVDAEIAGSGVVRLQSVTGRVNKQVFGSGDVYVGG